MVKERIWIHLLHMSPELELSGEVARKRAEVEASTGHCQSVELWILSGSLQGGA